jgi:hypothetical protein
MKIIQSIVTTFVTTFNPIRLILWAMLMSSSIVYGQSQNLEEHNHRVINKISALIINTLKTSKANTFDIEITADGKTFTLLLESNVKLTSKLNKKPISDATFLMGVIQDSPKSWVRLTLKDGLYSGAIYDGSELFFIEPNTLVRGEVEKNVANLNTLANSSKLIIYKASDVELNATCALEIPNPNTSTFDYSAFVTDLASMTASVAGRSINVKIMADTEYNTINNGDALTRMLSEMNVVDGIFSQQVNVELDITDTLVLTDNGTLNTTNSVDLVYNLQTEVAQTIGNVGVTHLFTGKQLDGSTVGIAFVDAICSPYGVGLSQNYGSQTALIVAHEIGHNFGAPHDAQGDSACFSTNSTFLMSPFINGSDQFSACSLGQIEQSIAYANNWSGNTCVVDIIQPGPTPPLFTSTAGIEATVWQSYQYDSDSIVEASGSTPLTFSFDFAPDGMTIDSNGLISWTPSSSQAGINPVQLRVSNAAGEDIQIFDIEVISDKPDILVNFISDTNFSYGGKQDTSLGNVIIEDSGATIHLSGNRWRAINLGYTITTNTILEFDFKSSALGEIHGIGFDNDLALSESATFNVFGKQKYGIQDFVYTGNGEYQRFSIHVGQYYTGTMAYLFFAMDHDVSNPSAQSFFSNVRVYEPAPTAPAISSAPILMAQIGINYQYDDNSTVEVTGTAPFTYSFIYAPEGMTIDNDGKITWIPSELQLGEQAVEIAVSNESGQALQAFTIVVSEPYGQKINLNNYELISYGGINGDTTKGTVSVSESGETITLIGNRWIAIDYPYSITTDSVMEFDFKSTITGEIHGIGLDTDLALDEGSAFNLHGTQQFGIENFNYTTQGNVQHFVIPLGEYLSGNAQYLFFAMDHDVSSPNATSIFSNIMIYEKPASAPVITSNPSSTGIIGTPYQYDADYTVDVNSQLPVTFSLAAAPNGMTIDEAGVINWIPTSTQLGTHDVLMIVSNELGFDEQEYVITVNAIPSDIINFNSLTFQSYGGQDTAKGSVSILDGGTTLKLVGNRWRAVNFNYIISPNSVLEFELKSSVVGEIHGIGLDNNLTLDPSTTFNLFGTQTYGLMNYRYSGSVNYQYFSIPIGQFFNDSMNYLFFAMDHDVSNPNAESYFRNVRIIER